MLQRMKVLGIPLFRIPFLLIHRQKASNIGCAEAGVLSKPRVDAEYDAAEGDADAASECADTDGDAGVEFYVNSILSNVS